MKKPTIYRLTGAVLFVMMLIAIPTVVMAQDHITIDKSEVKTWLQQNWIWVALGVLVLLIIIISTSSNRSRRRSTTVVKDDFGNVRRVTTEVVEEA
ncbi:MAG: hypothetical protein ABI480_13835 [Chitinophagaceae bacterium]